MDSDIVTADKSALNALKKKAMRASFWSFLEYGSNMGLRVISSLVLTRLLAPVYFGEMALVNTLLIGINLLSDVGLTPSVIQSQQGDEADFLNTTWTLQVLRGVSLWLIAGAISWPMAKFYHDPQLKPLLPVLGLSTLISSFNSTNLLSLSRHMGMRRLFAIDGSAAVVSLVVTIVWAYFKPSVWSIVAGQIVSTTYRLILSHIPALAPGIRNTFCWDRRSLRNLIHFGKWILVGTAFFFFASQADRLILGKLASMAVLGIYGLAYQISDVPRTMILAWSSKVAYPFVSRMLDVSRDEFRSRFLSYRFYILLLGAVLLALMVVWGNLLILHLYDRRYHDAAWMVPILAIGLWHTLLYQTTAPVLFSLGKPGYNAFGNAAYFMTMMVGLPLAYGHWGLKGAVVAIAAGDFPMYLVILAGATKEGVRPLRQDLTMTGIFAVLLMACIVLSHMFG